MTSLEKSTSDPFPPPTSLSVTISSSKIPSTTFLIVIGFVDFSIACGLADCTIVILAIFFRRTTCGGLVLSWFLLIFFSRLRRAKNLYTIFFSACGADTFSIVILLFFQWCGATYNRPYYRDFGSIFGHASGMAIIFKANGAAGFPIVILALFLWASYGSPCDDHVILCFSPNFFLAPAARQDFFCPWKKRHFSSLLPTPPPFRHFLSLSLTPPLKIVTSFMNGPYHITQLILASYRDLIDQK